MFNRFKKIITIIFRELSIFSLWLTASPPIINFQSLMCVLIVGWFPILTLAHLVKWGGMLFRRVPLHVPSFLPHLPAIPLFLLWLVALWGEIRLIHPLNPLIVVAGGGVTLLLHHRRWLHGLPITVAAMLHISLAIVCSLDDLVVLGTIFWLLVLFGGGFFKETLYRVPAWTVAMSMMTLITTFLALKFYLINGDADINKIASQPGVEILFSYEGDDDPIGPHVGNQIMFIQEGCTPDHVFIGSQYEGGGLIRCDLLTGEVERARRVEETSDDLIMDCDKNEMIIGDFSEGAFHFLDMAHWPDVTRPSVSVGHQVTRVARNASGSRHYFLSEGAAFFVLDRGAKRVLDSMEGPDEWIYDVEKDQFIVFTEPDFKLRQLSIGASGKISISQKGDLRIPPYKRLNLFLIKGPREETLLISDMWEGSVRILRYASAWPEDLFVGPVRASDLGDDFVEIEKVFVAPGIRNMVLTPDRKILIIAGYADGHLHFMDTAHWKIIRKVYLGCRMRGLNLSRDGKYVYVGSSQGGFRVEWGVVMKDASAPVATPRTDE